MIKRTVVKQQPVVRVAKTKVPVYHAHGCDICGKRFADTCKEPLEQGSCHTCRLGHPRTREENDRDPKQCCGLNSRLITDVDTLSRYGLAGHTAWFQCHSCKRTHPYDPGTGSSS